VIKALNELESPTGGFAGLLDDIFFFRRMECNRDYQRDLCKKLGVGHALVPTRVKIVSDNKIGGGWIYKFTSPLEAKFFKKKILRFSIPDEVISFSDDVNLLKEFDDIKYDFNVLLALESNDE
jgi:hypothetical protein